MLKRIDSVPPSGQLNSVGAGRAGVAGTPSQGSLTLRTHGGPLRCRVRLRGDLDLATAPALTTLAEQLHEAGVRRLVLDLSGLAFVAAAGLDALAHVDRRFRAAAGRVVLAGPRHSTRRLLRVTGLDTELTVRPLPGRPSTRRLSSRPGCTGR